MNPAGLAKAKGNTITISAAMISYAMEFTRSGTYDDIANQSYAYEGMTYPTMKNDVSPPLGIGSMQPMPRVAFVTDLGGRVKGLHLAAGLYAPNAYPFRDMCTKRPNGSRTSARTTLFSDFDVPPPSTRYDIMQQDAAVILPSLGVAYRDPARARRRRSACRRASRSSSRPPRSGACRRTSPRNVRQDGRVLHRRDGQLRPRLAASASPTARRPTIELGANYTLADLDGREGRRRPAWSAPTSRSTATRSRSARPTTGSRAARRAAPSRCRRRASTSHSR